ncbi:MAG: cytochrome c [Pseudolabrys sp.]|nr:cytochrome c [Pseudolabrys sp.]
MNAVAALATALVGLAMAAFPAAAEDIARGETLLKRLCASCHAVGTADVGKHPTAPAFRTLGRLYPIESLEEALAEGLSTGHEAMPEFQFDAADVGAIIAYLKHIQQP